MPTLLISLFIFYLLWAAFLYYAQRGMIYPIPPTPRYDTAAGVPGLQKLWLETSFGQVEAWYLPPTSNSPTPHPTLIFSHGNGELIDHWPPMFDSVRGMGIGVLLVEYPGYGRSEGEPSYDSIGESILAAYDALLEIPGVDPDRIIPYGRSLGGGAACILAAQRPTPALILQSTFTDTRRFARGYLLPGFLVRDKFDNLNCVRDYPGPVLVIHGRYDEMIPYPMAEELAAASPNAELITLPCGHNDCPRDWEAHWENLANFLRENGLLE